LQAEASAVRQLQQQMEDEAFAAALVESERVDREREKQEAVERDELLAVMLESELEAEKDKMKSVEKASVDKAHAHEHRYCAVECAVRIYCR
jgi:hypothetical protein